MIFPSIKLFTTGNKEKNYLTFPVNYIFTYNLPVEGALDRKSRAPTLITLKIIMFWYYLLYGGLLKD